MFKEKSMYTSDEIYIWFRDELFEKLNGISRDDFHHAWSNGLANKTEWYNQLFKRIGESKQYNVIYEQFRCDVTFIDQNNIPLVLIEMENAHSTASTEIEQLCCLNSPLKVLVISCEWHDSEKSKWLHVWQEIILQHNTSFPTSSKFVIVVGEWGRGKPCDDILRFYLTTLAANGTVIEEHEWVCGKT